MKILVYCPLHSGNIQSSLGAADYSYYFVMQRFLPLLREFGEVVVLAAPLQLRAHRRRPALSLVGLALLVVATLPPGAAIAPQPKRRGVLR